MKTIDEPYGTVEEVEQAVIRRLAEFGPCQMARAAHAHTSARLMARAFAKHADRQGTGK